MQPVEYYLKELLFDYDCVTIPGLGGFIMQSQPASINRGKNRILPPSRFPSFNSLLNHDDGLLVSKIARAGNISYREAGAIVSGFSEDCKKKVTKGEKIDLEGIGELSSGPDGGLRFTPLSRANFFAAVFGMEVINLYPLSGPQIPARLSQKPSDRKPRHGRERKPASVKWTLMLSLPVIFLLLYGIIFPSSIHYLYTNNTGLTFDLTPNYFFRQFDNAEPFIPEKTVVTEKTSVTEKADLPDAPVIKTPAPESVKKSVAVVEPVVQPSLKYYIIGGCFISAENADNFLHELINRGFEAEKAGCNNRGQIRISYKSFLDKPSAQSYLQSIRNEENPSAWLLKY
jgi:hypothetical protein